MTRSRPPAHGREPEPETAVELPDPGASAPVANGSNSDRFLAAFRSIEDLLTDETRGRGRTRRRPFAQMVDMSHRPAAREFKQDLRDLQELRNALVHMATRDGRPIAEPHDEAVELIERIARLMAAPPAALAGAVRDVMVCGPDDPLAATLERMNQRDVTTVPVIHRGRVIGLLTADTVTRWLGDAFQHSPRVASPRVADVLDHAANRDAPATIAPHTSAVEAVEVFRGGLERGRAPRAVLVTSTGDEDGKVLGVLTAADVPRLVDLASGR
ncbi:MAG: CBS domain-containing protein [Actinobacteria bacterium]|nr:CBS domain-containing protein [Thermoleophilia bacterium]MCB9010770.1 CBS domain-containing protein [Actinomycetota bacterium]